MLTDDDIRELLEERKLLSMTALASLKSPKKVVGVSLRASVSCRSTTGKRFSILACKQKRPNKFSVHVRYHPTGRRKPVTLIRCNGFQAAHENVLEKSKIPHNTFHIHMLTERYQAFERKELAFAKHTEAYHSFDSAVEYICFSYGFFFNDHPYSERYPLFPESNQ